MDVTAKNPRRKPRRSFDTTPLGFLLNARRCQWLSLLFLAILLWVAYLWEWVPACLSGITIGVAVALVPLGCWLAWSFPYHGYFLGRLHNLYRDLPWFRADSWNWVFDDQCEPLFAALEREDFAIHELDGSTLLGVDDLADALVARFGPMSPPHESSRKAAAILARVMRIEGGRHACVWHDAHVMANHAPHELTSFLHNWRRRLTLSMPHVLLFLVAPREETMSR
jgi:hypothetical protein